MAPDGWIQLWLALINTILNPATIALVVLTLFFRKELRGLLSRLSSTTMGPVQMQFTQQVDAVVKETLIELPRTEETNVGPPGPQTQGDVAALQAQVAALQEQLRLTGSRYVYELTYRWCFGSQINALIFLRNRPNMTAGAFELQQFHLQHITQWPATPAGVLDTWMAFLLNVGAVERVNGTAYRLTQEGVRFLDYLAEQSILYASKAL